MALAWLERLDSLKGRALTRELPGSEQERVKGFRLTLGVAAKHWTLVVGGVAKGDPATLRQILDRLGVPADADTGVPGTMEKDQDRKAWRWPVAAKAAA